MISTTVRIDCDLYEKICKLAYKERRSINSQMLIMFREYLEMAKWKK